MDIRYTDIEHDRMDAPFVGTLIAGITCDTNCPGCFHRDLLHSDIHTIDSVELMQDISSDPFCEGIILAGLEWTCQEDEMYELIDRAWDRGLKVIVYTHHTEGFMRLRFPHLWEYKGLYIKFGEYDEKRLVPNHVSYGVPLASSNQYIIEV